MMTNTPSTLFTLNNTDCYILESINSTLTETVLFSTSLFDIETNTLTVNAAIDYIQKPIIYSHKIFSEFPQFYYINLYIVFVFVNLQLFPYFTPFLH